MPPKFTPDNPGNAAKSIAKWFPTMFGIEISAQQVQAYWSYSKEFEDRQREAGQPFTNFTATVAHPSQVAIDCAAFLTEKGYPVEAEQIQGFWLHHKQWQSSAERRAERKKKDNNLTASSHDDLHYVINQRELTVGTEHQYDAVEGQTYSWGTSSSGAWKQLATKPGARFVYYRPGTATDGTTRSYFGSGVIGKVEEHSKGSFTAAIEDYEAFERPVPSAEGPGINHQTSIHPVSKIDYDKLVRLGGMGIGDGDLTLDLIKDAATKRNLKIDEQIYAQLIAALLADKHVILTGPPGTAKTTLAQAVAEVAQQEGFCKGFMPTTATADWTTFETIGGLRPNGTGELEFVEGHFLEAIRNNQWLLIDELNRSQFDRAFGQLFTVLSGQPVVLPYERPGVGKKIVLLPAGAESPIPNGDVLQIPEGWRIVATMNVFDKSLLFEMSFALMRRFAFIEVASPSQKMFEELIDHHAAGDEKAAELGKRLLQLRRMKDMGPAVFIDLTKFLRERITVAPAEDGQLLFEAFYSYLLPQFEGIDVHAGEHLYKLMVKMVASVKLRERVRLTLNNVLGLELATPGDDVQIDIAFLEESDAEFPEELDVT